MIFLVLLESPQDVGVHRHGPLLMLRPVVEELRNIGEKKGY